MDFISNYAQFSVGQWFFTDGVTPRHIEKIVNQVKGLAREGKVLGGALLLSSALTLSALCVSEFAVASTNTFSVSSSVAAQAHIGRAWIDARFAELDARAETLLTQLEAGAFPQLTDERRARLEEAIATRNRGIDRENADALAVSLIASLRA